MFYGMVMSSPMNVLSHPLAKAFIVGAVCPAVCVGSFRAREYSVSVLCRVFGYYCILFIFILEFCVNFIIIYYL